MKVLVVNNMAPFVWGGAEELADHLKKNLEMAGHESEILRIPFQWEPAHGIPAQMLLVRQLELWNVDRVIALKFPAYLIRHPHKTLWLLHQYRQAYDMFEIGHTNITNDEKGCRTKNMIINADNETFMECSKIFTNSDVTKSRLKKYNNFDAEVLLPPLNDPELFVGGNPEGYIFAGGRVNSMKRQYLLLEAMAKADRKVKLIIAGPPDTKNDAVQLQKLIEKYQLGDRVKLDLRFLPRKEYAAYMNNACACAYLPYDEDSLGYVSMEAATAAKPIITLTDSGGILNLVKAGETGWVSEPCADELTKILNSACANSPRVQDMGIAARHLWKGFGITWPKTIERLLQ